MEAGVRWQPQAGLGAPSAGPAESSPRGPRGSARHLQVEIFLPHRVQVPIDGFCPFLGLPNLDSDIGVTGSRLVLCLQALGTDHCKKKTKTNRGSRSEVAEKSYCHVTLAGDTCDMV